MFLKTTIDSPIRTAVPSIGTELALHFPHGHITPATAWDFRYCNFSRFGFGQAKVEIKLPVEIIEQFDALCDTLLPEVYEQVPSYQLAGWVEPEIGVELDFV